MRNRLIGFTTCLILALVIPACGGGGGGGQPQPVPAPTPTPTPTPTKIALSFAVKPVEGFAPGDKAGIFVVNNVNGTSGTLASNGNYVDNLTLTFGNGSWSPANTLNWADDKTKADFYCYYPYTATVANVTDHRFMVNVDQRTDAAFDGSRFMWGRTIGVAPSTTAVSVQMNPLMSTLVVKLVAGKGYTAEEIAGASVEICNLKKEASINLSTGSVNAVGNPDVILPKGMGDIRSAVVVPQVITNTDIIVVTLNGTEFRLNQTLTFEPGKQHECTLTIEKTTSGLDISVSGWDTIGPDYGGTV